MVIGGIVSVSATLDGAPLSEKSQRVEVRARTWADHLPPAEVRYESCDEPTDTCPATELTRERDTGVTFLPVERIEVNYSAAPIAEGPNTGWWFVAGTEPPVKLPAPIVRLNPQLFDPNSRFYATRRTCRPVDVQYWITEHENTHVEIGQERARRGWINGMLESRMAFRPATDPRFNAETVEMIRERLRTLLDRRHTLRDRYPDAPVCINLAAWPSREKGNSMRFVISPGVGCLLLVLGSVLGVPQNVVSQDRQGEVALRNDCRLAHQVLVHGQPANKYDWALRVIEDCGTEGAAAIAHELRDLRGLQTRTVSLDKLIESGQRLIDPELFQVAFEIAADEGAGEAARIQAIRLLASQVADADLPYEAFITDPIATGRVIVGPVTSRGPTVLRELPVQACADAGRLLHRLSGEAVSSLVRLAANQAYYAVEYGCTRDEAA